MLASCECGDDCSACEGCGFPECECMCDMSTDEEDENLEEEW